MMLRNSLPGWRNDFRGLVVVCLFITMARPLMAQAAGTGALAGTVTDSSGIPVAFAMVTATNIDTGRMLPEIARTDGTYNVNLPPGNYRVRFESAGYKTAEIPSARINLTGTAVLDGKLEANAQT